jgi:hypothetical protein
MSTKEKIDYIQVLNNELKELSSIPAIYINRSSFEEIEDKRILEGVNIKVGDSMECGMVDISAYISDYLMVVQIEGRPETVFRKGRNPFKKPKTLRLMSHNDGEKLVSGREVSVELTPAQKTKIDDFEKIHIRDHGPSNTVIGELFRAFRYIEYRAGNDGDCYHTIGSPTFVSYIYILSVLDEINWSWLYEKKIPEYNSVLSIWNCRNQIHWDGMLFELDFIKLILIDLLETGVIVDKPNKIDSRCFTMIKID